MIYEYLLPKDKLRKVIDDPALQTAAEDMLKRIEDFIAEVNADPDKFFPKPESHTLSELKGNIDAWVSAISELDGMDEIHREVYEKAGADFDEHVCPAEFEKEFTEVADRYKFRFTYFGRISSYDLTADKNREGKEESHEILYVYGQVDDEVGRTSRRILITPRLTGGRISDARARGFGSAPFLFLCLLTRWQKERERRICQRPNPEGLGLWVEETASPR